MSNGVVQGTCFERDGEGPDVVLVHGLGLNLRMWDDHIEELSRRYRVLRYDLLGHGSSSKPPAPYSMADFRSQLVSLVDALGIGRFALLGFSLGGLIAQAVALAEPQRVAALGVLFSAFDRSDAERAAIRARVRAAERGGPRETVDAALERWFTAEFARRHPEVIERVRECVVANDPRSFAAAYHVLAEADAELAPKLATIECSALVMTGAEDHGNSPDMAQRMAAVLPRAQCVVLPGLRHMALVEDPAVARRVLLRFLDDARSVIET